MFTQIIIFHLEHLDNKMLSKKKTLYLNGKELPRKRRRRAEQEQSVHQCCLCVVVLTKGTDNEHKKRKNRKKIENGGCIST